MLDADPIAPAAKTDQLWQAYQMAQAHYDSDLQLFSARMNLFLVIQSGLVAVVGGTFTGKDPTASARLSAAIFGLALCAAWLVVATSSYSWIKTWRGHLMSLARDLEQRTGIVASSLIFERPRREAVHRQMGWRLTEVFSWYVRPTMVTCCLPLLFVGGWIYIGWFSS